MTRAQTASLPHETRTHRHFDGLVQLHYTRCYRFAYKLTGSHCKAEELTQETFLRAYRSWHTYDTRRPFTRWLLRIAHNLFVDGLRAKKQVAALSLDALLETPDGASGAAWEVPDTRFHPEQILMEATLDERLERAVAALPATYRQAILLCDVQGLSYDEIAAHLHCSVGTIRSRIHRGRKLLQERLGVAPPDPATLFTGSR